MAVKILKDGTLLTWDEAAKAVKVLPHASVLVVGDRIAAIAETAKDFPAPHDVEIIDVEGRIVSPGFVNTHFHSWQSAFRSIGADVILATYFSWVSQMSETTAKAFTPDDIYISALEGYLEGLNAGVTSYMEHAHNNWSREVVQPGYDAAVDSGARIWWCYDVFARENFSVEEQWEALGHVSSKATSPPSSVLLGLSLDGLGATHEGIEQAKQMAK